MPDSLPLLPVFLLFEEPIGGYEIPAMAQEHEVELEHRRGWDVAAFGRNYGLKLVGADFFVSTGADPGSLAA